MNLRRAIGGPLLALVFFVFFAYVIFGVKWVFESSVRGTGNEAFLGSVSNGTENLAAENTTENATADIVQPGPMGYPELEINAESAISVESNLQRAGKILFEKASDVKLSIASLTKLMTAVVVLDNYNLSNTAVVDKTADSQAPVKQDVKFGDVMPVESFLDIMLVASSNKSAYALSELAGEQKFVSLMNRKAEELGLENTFFADPTGLSSQNVSTAGDLAKLAEYILKDYPKIADISSVKELYVPGFGKVTNTDQLLGEIPEIVCGKTGFTTEAKGCLLLIIKEPKNNDYLINVILGAEDRFSEMKKIINWSSATCN